MKLTREIPKELGQQVRQGCYASSSFLKIKILNLFRHSPFFQTYMYFRSLTPPLLQWVEGNNYTISV